MYMYVSPFVFNENFSGLFFFAVKAGMVGGLTSLFHVMVVHSETH